MVTLLLLRHGKSDWDAGHGVDHDRPLAPRGVRSARIMGRLVTREGLVPDVVISSTAERAARTAELAEAAGTWDRRISLDRRLYDAGPAGVLGVAAEVTDADRLLLVGHQPTWSLLVRRVTGEYPDLKTADLAVIDLPIEDWSAVERAAGTLVAIHHPRDHFDGPLDR
ncbi:MAG: histidine phosphatase family protein [Acidimicrobiia bacterium]